MCFIQTGNNALHLAAWGGHTDIINILSSKNPDMITHTNNVSKHYSWLFIVFIVCVAYNDASAMLD